MWTDHWETLMIRLSGHVFTVLTRQHSVTSGIKHQRRVIRLGCLLDVFFFFPDEFYFESYASSVSES